MAPNFQFAPADVDPVISKSCEGLHGLGYRGIQQTSVLSEKYGSVEVALKTRKKGRGISGQVCVHLPRNFHFCFDSSSIESRFCII